MSKPIDQELRPCPFCGKSDALVERLDNSSSMVICQAMLDEHSACMARGPVGIQDDDGEEQPGYAAAVLEWNARAALQPASVAVPEGWKLVPLAFVKGFGTLAHNYSLRAVPPDYYDGRAGDAFSDAYARCGKDLGRLRAMLAAAPHPPSSENHPTCDFAQVADSGVRHPVSGEQKWPSFEEWLEWEIDQGDGTSAPVSKQQLALAKRLWSCIAAHRAQQGEPT